MSPETCTHTYCTHTLCFPCSQELLMRYLLPPSVTRDFRILVLSGLLTRSVCSRPLTDSRAGRCRERRDTTENTLRAQIDYKIRNKMCTFGQLSHFFFIRSLFLSSFLACVVQRHFWKLIIFLFPRTLAEITLLTSTVSFKFSKL